MVIVAVDGLPPGGGVVVVGGVGVVGVEPPPPPHATAVRATTTAAANPPVNRLSHQKNFLVRLKPKYQLSLPVPPRATCASVVAKPFEKFSWNTWPP